ncbi:MAG: PBP1A family penicillin-binding protein [Myxococcales bacterium]|nr:PBP1A family penicillin-binding protein [Myxococcales bacterium]
MTPTKRRVPTARLPRTTPQKGQAAAPSRPWVRWLKRIVLAGLLMAALGASALAAMFWMWSRDLDRDMRSDTLSIASMRNLEGYHPYQTTVIYDARGRRIGEIFEERRTVVPFERMPPQLIDAVVATEDATFWEHEGIDFMGIVRATIENVRSGEAKQGASTITQQVVKTFFLSPQKTIKRKVQEIILARRIEKQLTKQEILSLYLNQINFGHARYGVQEAARFYFGKDVDQLNLGEAAMLAGLPQSPSRLSPRSHPEAAKARQTHVLNRMAETGKITREQLKQWVNTPLTIVAEPPRAAGVGADWVELVRQDLTARYGKERLATLGASVTVTLDAKWQGAAEGALEAGLRAYDARQKLGVAVRKVKPAAIAAEVAKLTKKLAKVRELDPRNRYEAVVLEVHEDDNELVVDFGKGPASVLLGGAGDARYVPRGKDGKDVKVGQDGKPSPRFAVGDVIKIAKADVNEAREPKHAKALVQLAPGAQGAVVVIDNKTRKVRALVGGYDQVPGGFNRALQAKRQPGSSFKPFVYGAALEARRVTPASIVNDAPEVFDLWKPKNYDAAKFEGPVRLRYALAKSINTVAIRVCADITPAAIVDFAKRAGIVSELPLELSIALGSGEVTPLEIGNAMATIASLGAISPPQFIDKVNDEVVPPQAASQVLDASAAYVLLSMMQSVITEGTGTRAAKLGLPIAGKTGTSNDSRDAWFIAATPDYSFAVWVGYDNNRQLGSGEVGGVTAVPIFVEMVAAMKLAPKPFPRPVGVEEVRIDRVTGLLADPAAPVESVLSEVLWSAPRPSRQRRCQGRWT